MWGNEEVVQLLLATNEVDINSKDWCEQTLLSVAAENGREAVVQLLLAMEGVDVESEDYKGRMALWWAEKNRHEAVVKLLQSRSVSSEIYL
ncbi:ankyrin [Glonium stellatum]|uniref:Ankyrin n=1 Tax=Glonium stellatum TaxID=574774 RepID=A0A8E2EW06_9PEZI|nr:ankyrin [Glonium stellatum]